MPKKRRREVMGAPPKENPVFKYDVRLTLEQRRQVDAAAKRAGLKPRTWARLAIVYGLAHEAAVPLGRDLTGSSLPPSTPEKPSRERQRGLGGRGKCPVQSSGPAARARLMCCFRSIVLPSPMPKTSTSRARSELRATNASESAPSFRAPRGDAATLRLLVADANTEPFADAASAYLPAMDVYSELTDRLRTAVDHYKRDPNAYDRWIESYVVQLPLEIRQHLRWETSEEMNVLSRLSHILAR